MTSVFCTGGLNVLFATLQMADEDPARMINTLIEKCEPIGEQLLTVCISADGPRIFIHNAETHADQ